MTHFPVKDHLLHMFSSSFGCTVLSLLCLKMKYWVFECTWSCWCLKWSGEEHEGSVWTCSFIFFTLMAEGSVDDVILVKNQVSLYSKKTFRSELIPTRHFHIPLRIIFTRLRFFHTRSFFVSVDGPRGFVSVQCMTVPEHHTKPWCVFVCF